MVPLDAVPKLPDNFNTEHRSVWVDIDRALFDRDVMAAEVIAGAGHLLEWDAPEQVSTTLPAFLNSIGR